MNTENRKAKKCENGLVTAFNMLSYQNDRITAKCTFLKARIDVQLAAAPLDRAVSIYLVESKGLEVTGTDSDQLRPVVAGDRVTV